MSELSHHHARNLIQAGMGSTLTQLEEEKLAKHLESCPACKEYTRQMKALENGLKQSFHARWDAIRGPSTHVVEGVTKKSSADLKVKKVFNAAKTTILAGVLIVIVFLVMTVLSRQDSLTPAEQPMLNITPTQSAAAAGEAGCVQRNQTTSTIVEEGDTIAEIAERYCLNPATIYWENREVLRDNNNALVPGIEIMIPVEDGEYLWSSPATSPEAVGVCQVQETDFTGTGRLTWPSQLHFISGEDYAPEQYQYGIDLAGGAGDPVIAADRGVVIFAGASEGRYGNMVVIDHGNGTQTLYAYLSTVEVSCGDEIEQGSLIGKIGATGFASGPALHFEVIVEGEHVNPHDYLPVP